MLAIIIIVVIIMAQYFSFSGLGTDKVVHPLSHKSYPFHVFQVVGKVCSSIPIPILCEYECMLSLYLFSAHANIFDHTKQKG